MEMQSIHIQHQRDGAARNTKEQSMIMNKNGVEELAVGAKVLLIRGTIELPSGGYLLLSRPDSRAWRVVARNRTRPTSLSVSRFVALRAPFTALGKKLRAVKTLQCASLEYSGLCNMRVSYVSARNPRDRRFRLRSTGNLFLQNNSRTFFRASAMKGPVEQRHRAPIGGGLLGITYRWPRPAAFQFFSTLPAAPGLLRFAGIGNGGAASAGKSRQNIFSQAMASSPHIAQHQQDGIIGHVIGFWKKACTSAVRSVEVGKIAVEIVGVPITKRDRGCPATEIRHTAGSSR